MSAMDVPTKTEVDAAVQIVKAVADAIRELGSVPEGHLYVSLCGVLKLNEFEAIVPRSSETDQQRGPPAQVARPVVPEQTPKLRLATLNPSFGVCSVVSTVQLCLI